jgi:MFS family permease
LLVGLEFVAFPVLGLFAGVWVDRMRRRPIMLAADVGPILALLSIPVAALFHVLTIGQLYVVSLVNGIFNVFYEVAYQSYLPFLVERDDLLEANQKLELSHSASHVVGPALGGILIQLFTAAGATLSGALSVLGSGIAILSIRAREPERSGEIRTTRFLQEMREGISLVFGHSVLRGLALADATSTLGRYVCQAIWLVLAYRLVHLSPGQVGLILGVGSLGYIPGALGAGYFARRLGVGRALSLSCFLVGLGLIGLPLALVGPAVPTLIVMWLLVNFPAPVFDINDVSLRQSITPQHLLGRMNATERTIVWSTMPVGSILGGLLGTLLGIPQALVLAGLISLLAPVWMFGSVTKVRQVADMGAPFE